jgi:ASC-1-like (ASCH) protein
MANPRRGHPLRQHMKYSTDINDRPFNAIKAGTKKVEGRTITTWETLLLPELRKDDEITFANNQSGEQLITQVIFVHHYRNVAEMLRSEGIENVLSSSPKTIKHAVESYNSIPEYNNSIPKYGIYAIGIKLL